jgi:hypothetical protein
MVCIWTRVLSGRVSFWAQERDFLFQASRLVLGPTQPPIQWVLGTFSPGVKIYNQPFVYFSIRAARLVLVNS